MTKEKTIEILNALWRSKDCGYSEREIREALDFAIMHIKKEPCKDAKKMGYFKPALTIAALYSNLKTFKHNYDPDDYVWILGKAVIKELKNPYKYPGLLTFDTEKMTIYGISVVVDYLNRYDIKIFENITEKINVDKKDKEERDEKIKMLMILKKQARYNDTNTLIEDVRLSSFNFVIDKVIKLLETESEEK